MGPGYVCIEGALDILQSVGVSTLLIYSEKRSGQRADPCGTSAVVDD